MTVLPPTSVPATTSPARTNRVVALTLGLLAAVSGLVPAAYLLLAM
jgi:hypothetical protein